MHTCEWQMYEVHANEMYACKVTPYEMPAHDEIHTYETHAHELHTYENHAYEMHARKIHAREIHAREMHARKVQACVRDARLYVRCTSTRYTPLWVHIWEVHIWEMYI